MTRRSVWLRAHASFLLCFLAVCSATRLQAESGSFEGKGLGKQVRSKVEYMKANVLPRSSMLIPRDVGQEFEECEETYGFFPCSTTLGGNLVLLIVDGYLMLESAKFLSRGSELLLLVSNAGIIGGLVLPILGAFPDALLILVSGLSGSAAYAQSQVLVGIGLLAGSNIMKLTLLWAASLVVGRCDLIPSHQGLEAKDKELTKGWSLTETGVTTDQQTRVAPWIMMITVLPYLIAQAPSSLGMSTTTQHPAVLVGCFLAFIGFLSYCAYQVSFPWIQQRMIYRARRNVQRSRALRKIASLSRAQNWGYLRNSDGSPNKDVLLQLFDSFDANHDYRLDNQELRRLITGLGIEHEGKPPNEDEVRTWMNDFDSSKDGEVSQSEFIEGMGKWMRKVNRENAKKRQAVRSSNEDSAFNDKEPHLFQRFHQEAQDNLTALLKDRGEDDEEEGEEDKIPVETQALLWAALYLVAGGGIAAFAANPLVNTMGDISEVTGIPPFFIAFVITPLATSSSEAMSSLIFAMKKRRKDISMTYSQIYGGVTLSNTLCLGIFLTIVYIRSLEWNFSSEVVVILVVTVAIGALASVRVTFPLWMAIMALLLYPFSILLVVVLKYVFSFH